MTWVVGDLLRCAALVSVVLGALGHGVVGMALMLLVFGATMIPRGAGLGTLLDLAFCGALLVAAWAALLDLYERWSRLDLWAHFVVTALLALVATMLVQKWGVLSSDLSPAMVRTALVILTFLVGTALAGLWEIGEWIGHTWLDPQIQVGYPDTMTDVVAGTLGSLCAGVVLAVQHARTRTEQHA
jgi:hypothetical protein